MCSLINLFFIKILNQSLLGEISWNSVSNIIESSMCLVFLEKKLEKIINFFKKL